MKVLLWKSGGGWCVARKPTDSSHGRSVHNFWLMMSRYLARTNLTSGRARSIRSEGPLNILEFTLQIKSVVAAFERMRDDLESEKRAMQKYWKSREKQIETVLGSVSNIYGAIEGYVGQKQLPQIDPLMLESVGEDSQIRFPISSL